MKKSYKAVLLSIFIAPGVGHFYLKSYTVGCLLLSLTFGALYILVVHIIDSAVKISDKIISGTIAPNIVAIRELVTQQYAEADMQQVSTVTAILVILWVVGVMDTYRVGRKIGE